MEYKNKIIIEDRYSNKILECHKNTIFFVGKTVATIRKSNSKCVDILDEKGNLLSWWCLEYVLKNPEIFVPIIICKDVGSIKHKLKIISQPFKISTHVSDVVRQ